MIGTRDWQILVEFFDFLDSWNQLHNHGIENANDEQGGCDLREMDFVASNVYNHQFCIVD